MQSEATNNLPPNRGTAIIIIIVVIIIIIIIIPSAVVGVLAPRIPSCNPPQGLIAATANDL